jgi:DNA-binding winged helix-turn-helix (wHTH) protein/tetratricopeptide (TPR) repeat protein
MSDRYRFGSFELDAAEHRLTSGGAPVALTSRAFDTLVMLVRHRGRLVTRDELIAAVWGDAIVEEGNLHWTISMVRRALAGGPGGPWIETVRGRGYRFIGPVEVLPDPDTTVETTEPLADPGPAPEALPERLPATLPPRRWRPWLAVGVAVLLLALVAWTVASRHETAGRLAVVGFRDLSPRGADRWVGTALAEMLTAELARSGRLRLIPSDDVAGMRRDLGLRLDGPMGRGELHQVRQRLGSEWVIVGSYLRLAGQDPPLRVDVLLRHTGTGETLAAVSRRGRETELFTLAEALAGDLRQALGEPGEASGIARPGGAVMPESTAAQKLYAEGLDRLRRRDARGAAERLRAAVGVDPGFPGAWLALANAYELLGFERQAEDASLQALQRSGGLPERQRLATEATYLRIARRMPEAVERLRSLYELSGHGFEEGLDLADTLTQARQSLEVPLLLADLHRRHPETRDDARLALLEAEALHAIEEYEASLAATDRAVAAARRQGMTEIEIRALRQRALGRVRAGTAAACEPALADVALARRKAQASGDRLLQANVLQTLGAVLAHCRPEDVAARERPEQESIALYREIGALGWTSSLLYNLGNNRLEEGDLIAADRLMREAYTTCQSYGTNCDGRFLHPMGANRLHRGELAEARRMLEEGLRINRLAGNRRRTAEAQSFLPDVAAWSGDLEQAVAVQREVFALRKEIGAPEGIAWAHSDSALWLAEAGHGPEARVHARQAVAMAAEHDSPSLDACAHAGLAFAHLASGDLGAADQESARAFARLQPPLSPFASFLVWRVRARVLLARGELDTAEAVIDQGLRLARRSGFVTYELEARLFRAQLTLARGRVAEARQLAADLAAEAQAKGILLIARRSAAVAAQAQKREKA